MTSPFEGKINESALLKQRKKYIDEATEEVLRQEKITTGRQRGNWSNEFQGRYDNLTVLVKEKLKEKCKPDSVEQFEQEYPDLDVRERIQKIAEEINAE